MDDDPDKWTKGLLDLIASYESSSEGKLNSDVQNLPGVKYADILDRLKDLRDEVIKQGGAPKPGVLEQVMIDWLKDVAPEKINKNTLTAIHKFACSIYDRLEQTRPRPK